MVVGIGLAALERPVESPAAAELSAAAFIENGMTTTSDAAPFALSVAARANPTSPVTHVCTGVFLGKAVAITAKHCLIHHTAADLIVRYGSVNLDAARRVKVKEVACSAELDVGLMLLDEPIDIPAAKLGSAKSGKAIAFGWGDSSFPSKVMKPGRSPNLLQVGMTITKEAGACQTSADVLCAEAPGAGPCAGDSGGPLVVGASKVVGVLSTVSSCPRSDDEESAATYVSGSSVKKWVQAAIKMTTAQRQSTLACE